MHQPSGNAAPWLRTRAACTAAILTLVLPGTAHRASAQTDVPPERRAAREWYQDARFGMFIHWGVYSLLGDGEWVMQNRKITVPQYEWLATTFDPVKFDAKTWVSLARAVIVMCARNAVGASIGYADGPARSREDRLREKSRKGSSS